MKVTGTADVARHDSSVEDNFTQCGIFYKKVLDEEERERLVNNIAGHLISAQNFLQDRAIAMFSKADPEYGARIRAALDKLKMASGVDSSSTKPRL